MSARTPAVRVTATSDGRPVVDCPSCATRFTPGVGKSVPASCIGCRKPYPFRPRTRALLDRVTGGITFMRSAS